jgi:similar to spore coat protein
MNEFLKQLMGMGAMTDQVIATDFLISAKAGVRNLAFAITESANPEARSLLREELRKAVETHAKITDYMMEKGYYFPYSLNSQIAEDMKITQTALQLSEK